MKALFRNLIWEAALAADNANPSYPITNIRHVFLKKAFRSTESTDTINIDFAADRSVDSARLAFTNATAAHLFLFDADNDLLFDADVPVDTLALDFNQVDGVRSAAITMTAPADLYVGSVGIGVAEVLPDPISNWTPGFIDNSTQSSSADGQVLINKIPALEQYQFEFLVEDLEEFYRLRALVLSLERPIFVDMFEGRRDLIPTMYSTVAYSAPKKDGRNGRFSLTITEAR